MQLELDFSSETGLRPELFENVPDPAAAETAEFQNYEYASEYSDEGFRMTEGGFEADGSYTPGHVCEVSPEACEFDPEMAALSEELDTWIEQGEPMSCCVATQTMALNQLEDGGYTEQELLDVAQENGWYNNGTAPEDCGKIAEAAGMEVHRYYGHDLSELAVANDPEVKVLANVDSLKLMYPECDKICRPDHSVQVLRLEDTPEGEMVIINDPGHPGGCGAVYPIEIFREACNGDFTTIRKEA